MRIKTPRRARCWSGVARAVLRGLAWSATLVALVGAGVGGHFGWRALQSSERLRLRSIEVRGTVRTSEAEVLAYAGVQLGDASFALDLDEIALRLRRHPWIRGATVRRRLPDGLSIKIDEHEAAIFVSLGGLYLANEDGELFKRFAASDDITVPVLTGLRAEEATGRSESSELLLRGGIALAHAVIDRQADLGRLEEVHWDETLGWSVLTAAGVSKQFGARRALWIHLGLRPQARLDVATAAVMAAREMGREPAVVFADGNKHPNRVHIRFAENTVRAVPSRQRQLFATVQRDA